MAGSAVCGGNKSLSCGKETTVGFITTQKLGSVYTGTRLYIHFDYTYVQTLVHKHTCMQAYTLLHSSLKIMNRESTKETQDTTVPFKLASWDWSKSLFELIMLYEP